MDLKIRKRITFEFLIFVDCKNALHWDKEMRISFSLANCDGNGVDVCSSLQKIENQPHFSAGLTD